jgi:hypothetical protein
MIEFVSAVDEIRIVDDFAENGWVFLVCHITLISVTLNGVIGKSPDPSGYADWRDAKAGQKPSENKRLY